VGPWEKKLWEQNWTIKKFFEVASMIFEVSFGEINEKISNKTTEQQAAVVFAALKITCENIPEWTRAVDDHFAATAQPTLRMLDEDDARSLVVAKNTKAREAQRLFTKAHLELSLNHLDDIDSPQWASLYEIGLDIKLLGVELPESLPNNGRDWWFQVRRGLMQEKFFQKQWKDRGCKFMGGTKAEYEQRAKGIKPSSSTKSERRENKRKREATGGGGNGGGGNGGGGNGGGGNGGGGNGGGSNGGGDAKVEKRERKAKPSVGHCYACHVKHEPPCYRELVGHECVNKDSTISWTKSKFGREAAQLVPPMLHLSDTFDTKGKIMDV
jgi:hypothetical protein